MECGTQEVVPSIPVLLMVPGMVRVGPCTVVMVPSRAWVVPHMGSGIEGHSLVKLNPYVRFPPFPTPAPRF